MEGAASATKSLQSCLTLCDPIDGSPPGSSVPGILQAGTLEWVAISFCMEGIMLARICARMGQTLRGGKKSGCELKEKHCPGSPLDKASARKRVGWMMCAQHHRAGRVKALRDILYSFFFILSLWNLVYILYSQHISVHTRHVSSFQ